MTTMAMYYMFRAAFLRAIGVRKSGYRDVADAVVRYFMAREIDAVRKGVCPYCGKRFKSLRGVLIHLFTRANGRCHLALERDLNRLAEWWSWVRFYVERGDKRVDLGDRYVRYSSDEELIEILAKRFPLEVVV